MGDTCSLHRTATGNWWLPDRPGDDVAATISGGHVFDPQVVEEGHRHIHPNTHVLDLGANFGQMSVMWARAHPGVMVHAVEAESFVAQTLRRNVDENHVNVTVYNFAAWHTGDLDVVFPEPDFVHFSAWGNYGVDPQLTAGRIVRTLAVDDIAFDAPISFMKIDVQGADLFAMQGARRIMAEHRMPVLFEFEPLFQGKFGTSWADYESFIAEVGYRVTKVIYGFNYLIEHAG